MGRGRFRKGDVGRAQYVFYNVVNPAERPHYARPPDFNELLYNQAIAALSPEEQKWCAPAGSATQRARRVRTLTYFGTAAAVFAPGRSAPSMVPVQAVGFEGLAKRAAAQDEMAAVYATKLEELEATINTVKRNLELSTGLQLAELKQRHVQNMQRMLHVRRHGGPGCTPLPATLTRPRWGAALG